MTNVEIAELEEAPLELLRDAIAEGELQGKLHIGTTVRVPKPAVFQPRDPDAPILIPKNEAAWQELSRQNAQQYWDVVMTQELLEALGLRCKTCGQIRRLM